MSSEDKKGSSIAEENQNEHSFAADGQKLQQSDLKAKKNESSQIKNEPGSECDLKNQSNTEEAQKKEPKKTFEREINKDLHDEILEKLDIKPKNTEQDIQKNTMQETSKQKVHTEPDDLESINTKTQVEKAISQDFEKIQKLVASGLINSVQGQNLKKQVLKKAFDMLVQTEKIRRGLSPAEDKNLQSNIPVNKDEAFEEFSKSNPDFFTSKGRKEVLNYLKSDDVIIGKDELNKISEIIRVVEQAAIDRYLQNAAHEKTLRDSNEAAKQRLIANAQKSSLSGNLSRTFTREQIGKMNSAEFTKYESQIMEQLKKGMIK